MMRKGLVLILGIGLLAVPEVSWGQRSPNWRAFKMADGLPESACVSVTISPQGKTLVRHLTLPTLSELDGYSVNLIPAPDKGSGRIYQSPGGQLWAVFPDGLREARDGVWISHTVPEIATQIRSGALSSAAQVALFPIRQGLVLFLLPNRLMQFSTELVGTPKTEVLREAAQTGLGKFTGMTVAADGGLWISGEKGIAKAPNPRASRGETDWQIHLLPTEWKITTLKEPHADEGGMVTLAAESGTNGQPVALVFDGKAWSAHAAGNERLLNAWRGPDNTFW